MKVEKRNAEIIKLHSEDEKFTYDGVIINEPAEHGDNLYISGNILLSKQEALELARRLISWSMFGTIEEVEAKTEGTDIKVVAFSQE